MVLQLGQALRRLMRPRVLRAVDKAGWGDFRRALQDAQGRAPFQHFKADLEAMGP